MAHLNGQRGRDADIAREAFVKYKMNESLTFKQERSKFEEAFKTLEYAQSVLNTPILNNTRVCSHHRIRQDSVFDEEDDDR